MDRLMHLQSRLSRLDKIKDEIRKEMFGLEKGEMISTCLGKIGTWYETHNDFYKILPESNENEIKVLYSRMFEGQPLFDVEKLYLHDFELSKELDEIPERLQNRIKTFSDYFTGLLK